MTDLPEQLEAWCRSYVSAFESGDADSVAQHWMFPALTTQGGRSYSFASHEHFAKNTARLLGFYKDQNVARVERNVLECHRLSEHAVWMTVSDLMRDPSGLEIAAWQATYLMQIVKGQWKAVMAVADGEVAAWAERGTPLGR